MGIHLEKAGSVIEIVLDWPEVRNAVGPDEGRELRRALEAAANEDVGALVLSSNGKAFCAGGNLPEILRLARQGSEAVRLMIYEEFQGVFRTLREFPVPVLVAVDGPAIGFGCDLALAGNVTFIGEDGWLAQGWANAGLIPATGGALYAVERGGPQAMWRLLAEDRVDGPLAERLNLAVACDEARVAARAMAARFAALPREPLQALTSLSRIRNASDHLAAAVSRQTGFLTDPAFAEAAKRLLAR